MIEVVSISAGDYYSGPYTSGSTVDVVLRSDNEFVSCDGILIWDEDATSLDDIFEEWKDLARAGEEGYDYWVTKS